MISPPKRDNESTIGGRGVTSRGKALAKCPSPRVGCRRVKVLHIELSREFL